jgi:hypothetical protein
LGPAQEGSGDPLAQFRLVLAAQHDRDALAVRQLLAAYAAVAVAEVAEAGDVRPTVSRLEQLGEAGAQPHPSISEVVGKRRARQMPDAVAWLDDGARRQHLGAIVDRAAVDVLRALRLGVGRLLVFIEDDQIGALANGAGNRRQHAPGDNANVRRPLRIAPQHAHAARDRLPGRKGSAPHAAAAGGRHDQR